MNASSRESVANTIRVSLLVCLVCALVVATAAVVLQPQQTENRQQFRQVNIVRVAGLDEPGMDLARAFDRVERRFVDFASGEYVRMPETYDLAAARDAQLGRRLDADPAGIRAMARVGEVFLVRDDAGRLTRVVLPVHGYGLWSTMYGFLALERDLSTVAGLRFYAHAETPGLGGEIDNPRWLAQWRGKELFDDTGDMALQVFKGAVPDGVPGPQHKVDGLSGATMTARGVQNLVRFWAGEQAYGPFLDRLRERLAAGENA
jgi:Na+-transporting NADH:ubiquinone oxidoreductase subunit C